MPLAEGQPAPAFEMQSTSGEKISLAGLKGKKVVLYFYPKDDTPGCTKEACAFRDTFADFGKENAVIYGVSPDDIESHDKFRAKFQLPFDLLADSGHKVAETFDVWKEKSMYGKNYMGIERTTFIIDSKGKIARIFPKVKVEGHHDEVLAAIKAAQ
jgi:thioredoxin-dependent peroxiredoxin